MPLSQIDYPRAINQQIHSPASVTTSVAICITTRVTNSLTIGELKLSFLPVGSDDFDCQQNSHHAFRGIRE
jgi:hypothetical protein